MIELRDMPPGIGLLYGRKGVGKTTYALESRPRAKYFYGPSLSIDELVEMLYSSMPAGEDIIIDEVQAIPEADKYIVSVYENLRHRELRRGRLLLITSSVFYAKKLGRSFLHGRFVYIRRLEPLRYYEVIPEYGERAYLLLGGVPLYLKLYKELGDERKVFEYLYDEVRSVLSYEFREAERYEAILDKLKDRPIRRPFIERALRIKNLGNYLERLAYIGLVRKIGVKNVYRDIAENFVRTYFLRYSYKDRVEKALEKNFEAFFRDPEVIKKIVDFERLDYDPRTNSVIAIGEKVYVIKPVFGELDREAKDALEFDVMFEVYPKYPGVKPIVLDINDRKRLIS